MHSNVGCIDIAADSSLVLNSESLALLQQYMSCLIVHFLTFYHVVRENRLDLEYEALSKDVQE